jgi:enoyl-CoA hydratase
MEYTTIIVEPGPLTWITLNRPERRNAINHQLEQEVMHALHAAEMNPDVRVIGLKGNGPVFSAGHDLYEVAETYLKGGNPVDTRPSGPATSEQIWFINRPIISAVHGFLGPQASIMVACTDLVVAAEGTVFSLEQARAGGGDIINPLWLHYLGLRRLKEWRMTFGLLPAEKAVEWGFINKVVPMDQLTTQVQTWADTMMSVPPQTVNSFKRGLNAMLEAQGVWSMKALHGAYGSMGHGSERDKEFYRIVVEKGLRPALEFRDAPHGGRQVGAAARKP